MVRLQHKHRARVLGEISLLSLLKRNEGQQHQDVGCNGQGDAGEFDFVHFVAGGDFVARLE